MESSCDVLAIGLARRVEVVGGRTILNIEVGDEDAVARRGGVVGGEDTERALAGAALDRGEAYRLHH